MLEDVTYYIVVILTKQSIGYRNRIGH